MREVTCGSPELRGAIVDDEGTTFSLFSAHADAVELCLFDGGVAPRESMRVRLARTGDVWHARVAGCTEGQRYGFRVHGPWAPSDGHRFNPNKLLADPCARAFDGPVIWHDALLGHDPVGGQNGSPSDVDSASFVPKSVVVARAPLPVEHESPCIPWSETVLYECHVRGMTASHPGIPASQRGRYAGLAHPHLIAHLRRMGVTTVCVLPVHQHAIDAHIASRGLVNYWGYNTLGYFAPDVRFASAPGVRAVHEFRAMVQELHAAGLELILDVVYNHTAEGGEAGATLCLRGIDNASYYRLRADDRSRHVDWTGCGNSLDPSSPAVLRLVLDSLRYWVAEMHVDGFRFDLASVLGRDPDAFSTHGRILQAILQDPVLSRVKLIAEPWDASDGYALGRFPSGFVEWNDRWRDGVRRFWRGDDGTLGELATRLSGSSDLFASSHRTPQAGISYVTCHDGFTLRDLVSHERKHNERNGEDDRDGMNENLSWNHGVEGETDRADVRAERDRSERALLATLAFSMGVPMLSHGDELGRTQGGNNNAYCHDDAMSWIDWDHADPRRIAFVERLFALRRECGWLHQTRFFDGSVVVPEAPRDAIWMRKDGREMTSDDWSNPTRRVVGLFVPAVTHPTSPLSAMTPRDPHERGETPHDHLLLLNSGVTRCTFRLPAARTHQHWRELLCSTVDEPRRHWGARIMLPARSVVLLRTEEIG